MINFGMLGLLRRLHRMHVQLSLECESQETGIRYPHLERHKVKDGHGKAVVDSVRLIAGFRFKGRGKRNDEGAWNV